MAINKALAVTSPHLLIERISILSDLIEDWYIFMYISGLLDEYILKSKFSEYVFGFCYRIFSIKRWNANQNQSFTTYSPVIKGFLAVNNSLMKK